MKGNGAMRLERWTSPAGKRRVLARLDPQERRLYGGAAAIAFPDPRIGPGVFGSPARATSIAIDRRRWRAAVRGRAAGARAIVVSDVEACYPSIGERAIKMAAARAGGDPAPLLRVIGGYRDVGGEGLPIGPVASAFVADAVLALADEAARAAGCAPVRWVDDVVFAGDRDAVVRASRAWRRALVEVGMREHDGKRSADPIGVLASPETGSGRGIMRAP
jgi:hypothetical protein